MHYLEGRHLVLTISKPQKVKKKKKRERKMVSEKGMLQIRWSIQDSFFYHQQRYIVPYHLW
jgi:hypothetical protein